MAGKFIVTRDRSGEYRFVLTASNGEVIAASEGYKQKGSAMNGIDSVRRNAADAVIEDRTAVMPPGHAD
ncbi:YegP family protein [Frigoribacterium sp. 2-23]|uniref:YegP family protein n=1 Tax=Frigoribacterium sp. 2-23 TaxID=3415006 RepID=UPI003C6FE790